MSWFLVWVGTAIAVVLVTTEQVVRRWYLRRLTRRDQFAWRRFFS